MVIQSWLSGWRRVFAAPVVIAGAFATTFLMAIPLALTMRSLLQTHLGSSLMANQVADGVSYDWWQEFLSQATGLGTTFTPRIIGFAGTLHNVSGLLDGQREIVSVASVVVAYLAIWTFLAGGILDRYARQRPTRAHGFFAASGVYFFRFLRLAIVAGAIYWWLFTYLHSWLFDTWYRELTFDLSVERTAFLWRLTFYALFGALLLLVNVVFDYAKIRTVVEDRRSVLGGLMAAMRFIARRPGRVFLLYGLNTAVFLGAIAVWLLVAPSGNESGALVWIAFGIGQLYLLARLALKLHFLASGTALFQASLAHAAYTAAPVHAWPESPAAEAVARNDKLQPR